MFRIWQVSLLEPVSVPRSKAWQIKGYDYALGILSPV